MSEEEVSGIKVKEERLMGDLHETCEWGKGEVWGEGGGKEEEEEEYWCDAGSIKWASV
ncbi:unnamed protein product, partial [Aureobasidium uvarum]